MYPPPSGPPTQDGSSAYQSSYPGYSLYVGNMDNRLTEPLFYYILSQFFPGQIVACKFFEEAGCGEPYCFIMFSHPSVASAALNILNGRKIYDKKLRINWAVTPSAPRQITLPESGVGAGLPPDGHAVYVGDFGPDVDDRSLYDAFHTFGEVRCARTVRDTDTGLCKGYGFVVFANQDDAETAISRMNGSLLGTRPVKVSWATRNKSGQAPAPLSYTDVYNQSPEGNTTIYVGGLPASMDDAACHQFFEVYGVLQECKYFPEKHYAFIKFDTHEAAATAIVRCNGQMVEGCMIKCWWTKDNVTNQIVGSGPLVPANPNQPNPPYQPSFY